jgi:ectoine hydroxylase-related dioxygenase (phytanoyl-CoA dioxygenase family)
MKTPAIVDRVADLVGPDVVGWASQVFCKVPGDPMEVPLHQDAIYYPFTPSRTVSVWIALDDVDAGNGAMEFVVGSHTLGGVAHRDVPLDGTRVLARTADDRHADTFINELPAGWASLHSDLLLHRSPPNRSNRRRAGIALRYGPASMRPVPGFESWGDTAVPCRGALPEWWTACPVPHGEHPELMANLIGAFDGQNVPPAASNMSVSPQPRKPTLPV